MVFVSTSCTSNSAGCAAAETAATNQAVTVGKLNLVAGAAPTIPNGNVSYDLSHAGDPLITVVVNATLNTYFMNLFGVKTVNVSSTATAEAYNPSGSTTGPTFCVSCLKPFLVPNCDPNHAAPANAACGAGGNAGGAFINANGTIANPGVAPAGIIGETWVLHKEQGPSHWFEVAFDCNQSGSAFEANVKACDTSAVYGRAAAARILRAWRLARHCLPGPRRCRRRPSATKRLLEQLAGASAARMGCYGPELMAQYSGRLRIGHAAFATAS